MPTCCLVISVPLCACLQLGLNHFADHSRDEYRSMLGYRADLAPERALQATPFRYAHAKPPPSVDWREKGAVTPVKNQEQVNFPLINCIYSITSDLPTRHSVILAVVSCCWHSWPCKICITFLFSYNKSTCQHPDLRICYLKDLSCAYLD